MPFPTSLGHGVQGCSLGLERLGIKRVYYQKFKFQNGQTILKL